MLRKAGYEAYLVGGCVRDLSLGVKPKDWDIATSATPEESIAVFEQSKWGKDDRQIGVDEQAGASKQAVANKQAAIDKQTKSPKTFKTGLKHGTITVLINQMPLEVTTFRQDVAYSDNRHPDAVVFTKLLKEDMARRDFTINALALDENNTVIDHFGGKDDLVTGIIRCVGKPCQRFAEDALRILRALRFSAMLGFTIDPKTAAAIHQQKHLLNNISAERINAELSKLLCGQNAGQVLRDYADVLCVVIPEIEPMIGFDQKNPYHCFDVWQHTVAVVENSEPSRLLRWTALFHDIGKPASFSLDCSQGQNGRGHFYGHAVQSIKIANTVMHRLKFDNETRKNILTLIEHHDAPILNTKKAVRRSLNRLGTNMLQTLLKLQRADNLGQDPSVRCRQKELDAVQATLDELLAEEACFSLKDLAVDGKDMLELGLAGREIGQALAFLLNAVIDEQVSNSRSELLDYLPLAFQRPRQFGRDI
jgi:tRNA nucleotidyltransferase (CCA-adding enzyme)